MWKMHTSGIPLQTDNWRRDLMFIRVFHHLTYNKKRTDGLLLDHDKAPTYFAYSFFTKKKCHPRYLCPSAVEIWPNSVFSVPWQDKQAMNRQVIVITKENFANSFKNRISCWDKYVPNDIILNRTKALLF